jgi:hypothetical protein
MMPCSVGCGYASLFPAPVRTQAPRRTGATTRHRGGGPLRPATLYRPLRIRSCQIHGLGRLWRDRHREHDLIGLSQKPGVTCGWATMRASPRPCARSSRRIGRTVMPAARRAGCWCCPPGATGVLVRLLQAPGRVCVESEELGYDRPILAALGAKEPSADLLLPTRLNRYHRRIARYVASQGVHVRFLRTPYLHAKLIAEPTQAFIGSENLKPLEPSSQSRGGPHSPQTRGAPALCSVPARLRARLKTLRPPAFARELRGPGPLCRIMCGPLCDVGVIWRPICLWTPSFSNRRWR